MGFKESELPFSRWRGRRGNGEGDSLPLPSLSHPLCFGLPGYRRRQNITTEAYYCCTRRFPVSSSPLPIATNYKRSHRAGQMCGIGGPLTERGREKLGITGSNLGTSQKWKNRHSHLNPPTKVMGRRGDRRVTWAFNYDARTEGGVSKIPQFSEFSSM